MITVLITHYPTYNILKQNDINTYPHLLKYGTIEHEIFMLHVYQSGNKWLESQAVHAHLIAGKS